MIAVENKIQMDFLDKVENVLHLQVTSANDNRYMHQAKRNSDLQSVHA
jgi:hypothetical protein